MNRDREDLSRNPCYCGVDCPVCELYFVLADITLASDLTMPQLSAGTMDLREALEEMNNVAIL